MTFLVPVRSCRFVKSKLLQKQNLDVHEMKRNYSSEANRVHFVKRSFSI